MSATPFAKPLLALLVASALTAPAQAKVITAPDDQPATLMPLTPIRTVLANNRTPIAIDVLRGDPLVLEFPDNETINDIAVGGVRNWKATWEIVKRGSRLFVRQIGSAEKQRKMIITTTAHSYVFYLEPHDVSAGREFVSKLIVGFEPPVQNQTAAGFAASLLQAAAARQGQVEQKAAPEAVPRQPVFTKRNYAYSMQIVKESVDIRPRAAWDDGRFTYFMFPKNIPVPAVYRTVPGSQEEAQVNWHIDGDELVVHGISPAWNLRFGESVIGVFNERYNAEGIATPNNTTTVEVRESK